VYPCKIIFDLNNKWYVNSTIRGTLNAGVEKKEEDELKEQMDMKVSTKFQITTS
jgi:hypothetical protein